MKKEEVKITSFQAENYRLQLLYITKEMKNGTIKKEYEVRENRKVICSTLIYDNAKTVYTRCINDNLGNEDNIYSKYLPDQIQLSEFNINDKAKAIYYIDLKKTLSLIENKFYYQVNKYLYNNIKYKLKK